jgi:outer membrane protein OmpA-like peptidoglycan-associated protein
MTTDTNLSLSNKDADTYFKGEVIGIGISSNESKNETPTKIGDTQINITNTLTANRTETAPKTPQGNSKSTIGAYINYGEVNLTNGHIVVENSGSTNEDIINDNGIGIYSKNGSEITTDKDSSITVHGNNGIGIYAEATKEFYEKEDGTKDENKNKFGGDITQLNINNAGDITLSGESGVGIYADGGGTVTNSGNITVGGGAEKNSSIGIYGINTNINNTGKITVGCNHNENKGSHTGVGIYAVNSTVTTGGTIALGDYATGIYLDGNSNLDVTNKNEDLTFTSLENNTTDRIGIYAVGEEGTNDDKNPINIDFNIDMSNVIGGKAIIADGRNVILDKNKKISISTENGRGMRASENATITNNGTIEIGNSSSTLENSSEHIASIGMTSANKNGKIYNYGRIDINSNEEIGIYVENNGKDKTGNSIESIGTINLNGNKSIAVLTKGNNLNLDGTKLSIKNINFGNTSSNNIGIYAENSNITVNEDISKTFTKNQTNNILIAGVGNSQITNNKTITVGTSNEKSSDTIGNNVGIYLKDGGSYKDGESGSIKVNNGNIGIYADKGAGSLENINITSDSMGIQTIGVVLNGENKENKNISGTVTLTNSNNEVVQGKNLGIYANNSDVTVSDNLTLFNDGSNGTGLYLNNSTLSGKGTIKIIGEGKENSEGKISNSVGIYYTSNEQEGITSSNSITVEVDKSNTIGVYVANGSTLTKQSGGGIIIGTTDVNKVENVTGLVTSAKSTINNNGIITLGNTSKSIGIASLGGTVNNSGKITIGKNSKNGTGIFLSGESKLENTGTITIAEVAVNDKDNPDNSHLGIGIYAKGENVKINSTGNFDIASGNVAIYSDGTNISSNIKLADSNDEKKNSGTIALVVKSDRDSTEDGVTKGTAIGGTDNDKMEITLAKGSTGIYALDSGVTISNVSIDATANEGKNGDLLSYGIYLGAGKEGNTENYEINNTDISLVKGVGIVVNTTDKNKDTSLTLTNSTLNIDSYSEGDKAETGIGIYTQSGNITLAGGNTINTTYGVGIFGGKDSNINIGNGATKDTLNIKGYSVGVYSKGGEVNLGANTEINFQKGAAQGESPEVSKGVGAYVIDGNITSSANINTTDGVTSENVVGLLGKQTDDKNTDITITNKGNIDLAGNSVIGIAGLGSEKSTGKVTITNEGTITISGNEENLSTGIYGENAGINNTGTLMVGQFATGIFYTGTKDNNIFSNDITLNDTDSMGAVLKGTAGVVNIGNITGSTDRSLGIYLDNYKSSNTNIGDITLKNNSMGLYINNSNTTIDSIGNISTGDNGIGIASVGNSEDDIVTIANNGAIKVGDFGTAVYVKDSTLNMKSLAGVTAGKNGTVLHVNDGTLNLDSTINELTFDGNIGMILENGGDITSTNDSKVKNISVINGGTGIIVKGNNTKRPGILADNTTINLGSGNENSYSVGLYYQDADVISNNNKDDKRLDIDIVRENGSHHTIGTIYDRTYGTIDNFNIVMNNSTSNSIGTIIRRDTKKGNYEGNTDENKVVLNSGVNSLVDVNGQHNIGIIGKNSIIEANGDIKVGLDETSSGSIGVYLTGTDSEWKHSYTGKGDINVGSHSIGIYAKNYDTTHNGNITASGKESVGIASVILDDEEHGHPHTITVNDSTLTAKDGAIGIFGRDTNIDVNNGTLNVSGNNSTGIASLQDGDINFTGSANISGKGSSGIYKNTILDNTLSQNKSEDTDTIIVGNGNWIIDDTASGIVAISRNKDANGNITDIGNSIKIDNSSNMTLGNGAIGIYSAGANIVNNKGNITVGAASIDGKDTLASIGIYMANGVGNTMAIGTNNGNITVENNGGVGIQVAGYVDFTNNGDIKVSDGAEGLHSSYGAKITNTGEITVTGKGTGMIASGKGSEAINNGTIKLEKDNTIVVEDGANSQYNTSLIGMAAVDGGHIINGKEGIINVNDGIGMYVDEISSFANSGTINVNNGVGIMGVGKLENIGGTINVSSNGTATVELDENLSDKGSLVVNREENILEVNDNFSNIGGILETDYNIKLNNPTVDITAGGAGFIAPNISGDIKLDSNFALEGNGLSFSVEDFIDPEADININTSPLFKTDITEGDLTVNKVDYKDITLGNQFDNRDNSLDNILANGGVDADILKNLNYYLDSLGNTPIFDSEADRLLGAIGGNIYSNIQSRMQDISRTFDNSFEEMVTAPNPTYENTKYSLIYTNGDYENKNENVVDYEYDIKGINYMKEYDLSEQGKRYGYTFGFTGAKFEFDDFSKSEEDIYSLRGGAHRISYLDNSLTWFSRAEVGYNHHRVDRKVYIPGATENGNINNKAWYGSYQVSLDNKLRKEIFANENSNFGAYTALNLEYGLFDDIKESGNLELKVKSNDYFSSKAVIGLDGKFSKPINDNWSIRLNGDINYSYDFGDNYDENDARFRSQDSYYSLASEVESRDVLSGKLSVGLDKSDYMSIALHAQAFRDFRRDEDYWNAGLTFTYRFNNHAVPEKFLDMHNYFKFDNSELNSNDKENIKEMAEYINKNNMQGTLLIEGHTDDTGKASYNDKLSLKRANAVKEEFEKTLTNKDNIQVKVIGHGEEKPEYKNINESARSKNRRAQVNILNK